MSNRPSSAGVTPEQLATLSHEFRTPLNGVLGMARLLEGTRLTAEQRAYVGALRESGDHLLSLVNDVLDFARLGAHGDRAARRPGGRREPAAPGRRAAQPPRPREGHRDRLGRRARPAGHPGRRGPPAAGAAELRRQRHQVHRDRRGAAERRTGRQRRHPLLGPRHRAGRRPGSPGRDLRGLRPDRSLAPGPAGRRGPGPGHRRPPGRRHGRRGRGRRRTGPGRRLLVRGAVRVRALGSRRSSPHRPRRGHRLAQRHGP